MRSVNLRFKSSFLPKIAALLFDMRYYRYNIGCPVVLETFKLH